MRATCPEQSVHKREMSQERGFRRYFKIGVEVRTKEKTKVKYSLPNSCHGRGA